MQPLTAVGELVFSHDGGARAMDPGTASREVTANARMLSGAHGTSHFTGADLRCTAETMLASIGVDKETRAQLLSHGRTTGIQALHYDRHHCLSEKGRALEIREAHLREILADRRGGKIATLNRVG
jgi:hypothetical protein